jgi:hypothetical protein
MSAIGISNLRAYPAPPRKTAPRIICAHADHRRADFIFQRTQSLTMRDAPWENRIRPMRSWSEISIYGFLLLLAATTLLATVA